MAKEEMAVDMLGTENEKVEADGVWMTPQKLAERMGWALAVPCGTRGKEKIFWLVDKQGICRDGNFEQWIEPFLGMPQFLVIKNGKIKHLEISLGDLKMNTVKICKQLKEANEKYKYGIQEWIYELYKKRYGQRAKRGV